MGLGAIVAGDATVRIGGDDSALMRAMAGVQGKMKAFGASMRASGAAMMSTGVALGAAFVLPVMQFANYEQGLADLRAASNPTAEQFDLIKEKIEAVAKATGMGPVEVTQAFNELIKAGRTIDEVLGGLGEATVQFAMVGMMPLAQASTVLVQAMNTFKGTTAADAMNIISQAADASLTSIQGVSDSFANVGAVAAGANQSMRDTATAIGLLSGGGLVGAEAGTALRTVLTRLTTGSDGAQEALTRLGVSAYDTATGQVRPLIDIVEDLGNATAGMSAENRNRELFTIAGAYGQNALRILMAEGRAGWTDLQSNMANSLTVEQKFAIMTDTLMGAMKKLWVHIQFVAIEIGGALAPALRTTGAFLGPVLDALQTFIKYNSAIIKWAGGAVAALTGFGAAWWLVGAAASVGAWLLAPLIAIAGFLAPVLAPVAIAVGVVGVAFAALWGILELAGSSFGELWDAIVRTWDYLTEGLDLIDMVGIAALAIGAGLAVTFGPALVALSPLIAGIGVLAGLAYLVYDNWESISGGISSFFDLWLEGLFIVVDAFGAGIGWIGQQLPIIGQTFTAVWSSMTETASIFWTSLRSVVGSGVQAVQVMIGDFTAAYGAIGDMIAAGDWAGAFETGWLALRLAFEVGTNWIKQTWNELGYFLLTTWDAVVYALAPAMQSALTEVVNLFFDLQQILQDSLTAMLDVLPESLRPEWATQLDFAGGRAEALAAITGAIGTPEQRVLGQVDRTDEEALRAQLAASGEDAAFNRMWADMVAGANVYAPGAVADRAAMVGQAATFGSVTGSFSAAALSGIGGGTAADRTAAATEQLVGLTGQTNALLGNVEFGMEVE